MLLDDTTEESPRFAKFHFRSYRALNKEAVEVLVNAEGASLRRPGGPWRPCRAALDLAALCDGIERAASADAAFEALLQQP